MGLAPFLERDVLRRLVGQLAGSPPRAQVVAALAPFLDRATLDALIRGSPASPES